MNSVTFHLQQSTKILNWIKCSMVESFIVLLTWELCISTSPLISLRRAHSTVCIYSARFTDHNRYWGHIQSTLYTVEGWHTVNCGFYILYHINNVVHFSPSDSPDTINHHNTVYLNSRLSSICCIAGPSISLFPSPLSLSPWLEALIPRSNQGYTAATRIHIILHFNHISIDLHLLNIMIIARLVLLIAYGSL